MFMAAMPSMGMPSMKVAADFAPRLSEMLRERGVSASTPVLFLCRSGARSRAAAIALTQAGYAHAFNVAGGFEGDLDEEGHRGNRDGWKVANLPWRQG